MVWRQEMNFTYLNIKLFLWLVISNINIWHIILSIADIFSISAEYSIVPAQPTSTDVCCSWIVKQVPYVHLLNLSIII